MPELIVAMPVHAFLCFDQLAHCHKNRAQGLPEIDDVSCSRQFPQSVRKGLPPEEFNVTPPIFVTWKTQHRNGQGSRSAHPDDAVLRGCKGCTSSNTPLPVNLRLFAFRSGFEDGRFAPLSPNELPRMLCTVSILSGFEKTAWDDWDMKVHGVVVDLYENENWQYRAMYLPEVALNEGWDHKTTIKRALQKGGYSGWPSDSVLDRVEVTRFVSSVHTCTYDDYLEHVKNYPQEGWCAI